MAQELNFEVITNCGIPILEETIVNFNKAVTVLNENDRKIIQVPVTTNFQLYEHQKTLIYRCLELEENMMKGIDSKKVTMTIDEQLKKITLNESEDTPSKLKTNFGVICDGVGSGKSYVALSLIALKPFIEPYNFSSGSKIQHLFYNKEEVFENNHIHFKTNLLIVTHGTVGQWKSYIKKFPTIKAVFIDTSKAIEALVGNNELRKKFWMDLVDGTIHCLLISSTFYDKFFNRFLKYRTKSDVMHHRFSSKIPDELRDAISSNPIDPPQSVPFFPERLKVYNEEDFTLGDENNFFVDYIAEKIKKPEIKNDYNLFWIFSFSKYIYFSRIIIDEVDTIKLTKNSAIFGGLFNWMISSSIGNLLFPKSVNGSKIFSGFQYSTSPYSKFMQDINSLPHSKELFIKNDDEYVKAGINLPPITYLNIPCKSMAVAIKALGNDNSMNGIITMLMADDYDGISEHFQCFVKTPLEVMEAYKKNLGDQISNKEKEFTYVSSKTYSTQKVKDSAIEKVSNELKSLKIRLESLVENITSIDNENSCAICYDKISKPVLFPCCGHVFCGQCIFDSIKAGIKNCVYCNAPLDMSKITLLTEKESKKKNKQKDVDHIRPRLDECIHQIQSIFEENKEAKLLIFSEFDGTFKKVSEKLSTMEIKYEQIQGSSAHIQAMIKRFGEGETKILLLNSRAFGVGLNIPQTTHMIIYHKMPENMTIQVIGRAQRAGRTCPLKVYQLLSEDEK